MSPDSQNDPCNKKSKILFLQLFYNCSTTINSSKLIEFEVDSGFPPKEIIDRAPRACLDFGSV